MTISERLFEIMKEKEISVGNLSRLTGISRQTIYDWQKKNTNPGADKIMIICEALQVTPEELLAGKRNNVAIDHDSSVSADGIEIELIKEYQELSDTKKKRLLAYMNMLQNTKEKKDMDRNVEIITDSKGNDEYNLTGSNTTAIINDTNGDDIYNINLRSGTSVVINEATSSSQNDTLNINTLNFGYTRLYFDVQMADTPTGLTTNSLFIFNDKDDLTLDNIESANFKGIKITDQYKGQRINTIVFENYTSANINNWVSKIQSDVVGWLNNNTGYSSTTDVLNSGNEADINALLAVYDKGYYSYNY